jgi:short-subunit dehydrogenase
MKLSGANVIVTGASSGIGRETAREFAKAGSNVVLASRNEEALRGLAGEMEGLPGRAVVVPTDVTDRAAVEAMAATAVKELGSIEALVNNAGLGLTARLADGSMENIRYVFEVNVFGAINCIQAVLPHMKERKRGMIIGLSSVAGRLSTPYFAAYSATKASVIALDEALRLEVEGYGIRVMTVFPGYTITAFQSDLLKEVPWERPSRLVRGATAEMVAKAIVRAARKDRREAYATLGDRLAVAVKMVSPRLIDAGMRRLWLAGRKFE